MLLIADSGSTKTDWRLLTQNDQISSYSGKGLNPDFHTVASAKEEIANTFKESIEVKEVHFYGAGCSTEARNSIIKEALKGHFSSAKIFIEHDVLGSARAVCGHNEGVAGILGTGSNCCVYNGSTINQYRPSGGYILSDEGGGVDIGKAIIKAAIEKRLPKELQVRFDKRYNLSYDDILKSLYKKDFPNKFLASFSKFAFHNKQHPYINNILQCSFRRYFKQQVKYFDNWQNLKLGLVGSVAFYYQDIIRSVAAEEGVEIGLIIEKPISALCNYHRNLASD